MVLRGWKQNVGRQLKFGVLAIEARRDVTEGRGATERGTSLPGAVVSACPRTAGPTAGLCPPTHGPARPSASQGNGMDRAAQIPAQQAHATSGLDSQSTPPAHAETPILQGSASSCETLQNGGMEAAGIEPASRNISTTASTYVAFVFPHFASEAPEGGVGRWLIGNFF